METIINNEEVKNWKNKEIKGSGYFYNS